MPQAPDQKTLPDLRALVRTSLEQHGYDGLFHDAECCCHVGDLMCCDSPSPECQPGYKVPCGCGEGCVYHISPLTAAECDARFGPLTPDEELPPGRVILIRRSPASEPTD